MSDRYLGDETFVASDNAGRDITAPNGLSVGLKNLN